MIKVFKIVLYLLVTLSLLPMLTTYFAYGNVLEMGYFAVTLIVVIGLLYLVFTSSKLVATGIFFMGVVLFIIELIHLKDFWFNNQGGDLGVTIIFTLQAVLMLVVLWFLFKESTFNKI